jgi:hypothetical protein
MGCRPKFKQNEVGATVSYKYVTWAFKMPTNPMETLVLVALADYADDVGYCFPGYESIIEKTKLAKSSLAKTLFILEGAGFFKKTPHATIGAGRKVNSYQILFDESWFETVPGPSKSMRIVLIKSIRIELIAKIKELRDNKRRAISSSLEPRKVHRSNSKSTSLEHEQSYKQVIIESSLFSNDNPTKKTGKGKPAADVDQILTDFGITGDLAEDFKIHRKAKKAAITRTAMKGFAREAAKAGIAIADAVEIAIDRGWVTFNANWDWRPKSAIQQQSPPPEAWADSNFLELTAAELASGSHLSVVGSRK